MAKYKLEVACSPYNSGDKRNIRVAIHCTPIGTIDAAIFAFRNINDELLFDHVCSTVDLVEYPKKEDIINGESFKWCRSDTVDILVRTMSIAEDFIECVKEDVEQLYANMQAHNNVIGTKEYIIGD